MTMNQDVDPTTLDPEGTLLREPPPPEQPDGILTGPTDQPDGVLTGPTDQPDGVPIEPPDQPDGVPIEPPDQPDEIPIGPTDPPDEIPIESADQPDEIPAEPLGLPDGIPNEPPDQLVEIPTVPTDQLDGIPSEPTGQPDETPAEPSDQPDETPIEPTDPPDETPIEPTDPTNETPIGPTDPTNETPIESTDQPDETPAEQDLTDPSQEHEAIRSTSRQAQRAATRATKESLIAQAELVAMMSPANTAPGEMQALLGQWKRAGRTTKTEDNALWIRFNMAQDQLFTRLDLLREQRQAEAAEAKRLKESLISTAEDLASRADIRQAVETMTSLMGQWKLIGHAPDDKGLWLRFKAAHDQLFARRDQERSKMESDKQQAVDAKRALIARVRDLLGAPDLRQAHTDLRTLQIAFREAGYAGRELNKKLADQFHEAQQEFYAWARKEPIRRRDSGEQGSYGRRARIMQQIDQVKAEIARAEDRLKTTDPSGAKKSRGSAITLTRGQSGAYTSAAAETMRLKIQLADLEGQIHSLDSKLGRS